MILTVLPERDSANADTQKLRKHMRWALNELDLSETEHRIVHCINGCLAQNLDASLQHSSASNYRAVIVSGARMFLALALTMRPSLRPERYVVFLGPQDAADVPHTAETSEYAMSASAPSRHNRGSGVSRLWQSLRCRCNAVPSPCDTMTGPVVPASPRCSVLVIDTSNGDSRMMPWLAYLRDAITARGMIYEWMSALSGYASAARDGARIVDFLR